MRLKQEPSAMDSKKTTPIHRPAVRALPKSFVAGAFAGMLAKSALAPIDRVKILFQVGNQRFTFYNAVQRGIRIYQMDGFQALFRGNSASILRVMPYAGIQHSSFDFFKRKFMINSADAERIPLRDYDGQYEALFQPPRLSTMQLIMAGSLAGATSVICTYPLDILRARLVVQQGKLKYKGVLDAFVTMYKAEGIRSLGRGICPTLLGILPYTGVGFGLNDYFKHKVADFGFYLEQKDKNSPYVLHSYQKFLCSYFACCIAQTITYPLDTIRRRMQTQGYMKGTQTHDYSTIASTFRHVYTTAGVRGIFKGMTVNWLRGPMATAISLTAYDLLKELLNVEHVD